MEEQLPSLYSLGIVGAGQIARMTHRAALKLGITPRLLAESLEDSAALAAPDARFNHPDAISGFVELCDVVTFEHERLDIGLLQALETNGTVLRPGTKTLRAAFDKMHQRRILSMKGFTVPAFAEAKGPDDIIDFASQYSYPIVIKSIRSGNRTQDGVWIVQNQAEAMRVMAEHGARGLMVEEHKEILEELVVIVARRPGGNKRTYPISQFKNCNGMCQEIVTPADIGPHIAKEARTIAENLADELGTVGVLSVELFLTAGGLVINELAARPHNAGHYTIEGCITSQFENHVRAILDFPLGSTQMLDNVAVTLNVVGNREGVNPTNNLAEALAIEGAQVHLYGKIPSIKSKLGHVTALGQTITQARDIASRAEAALLGRRYLKGERN